MGTLRFNEKYIKSKKEKYNFCGRDCSGSNAIPDDDNYRNVRHVKVRSFPRANEKTTSMHKYPIINIHEYTLMNVIIIKK